MVLSIKVCKDREWGGEWNNNEVKTYIQNLKDYRICKKKIVEEDTIQPSETKWLKVQKKKHIRECIATNNEYYKYSCKIALNELLIYWNIGLSWAYDLLKYSTHICLGKILW